MGFFNKRNGENRFNTRRSFQVQLLEDRCVPATLVVNSLADNTNGGDGMVTLREAIIAANTNTATDLGDMGVAGLDTIVFDPSLDAGGDILIGASGEGTQFDVTDDLAIDASSITGDIVIDAESNNRIFYISTNLDFSINNLTLTGGSVAGGGGAISFSSTGTLEIIDSTLTDNTTAGNGGAINLNGAVLNITNSSITNNSATGSGKGGGINGGLGGASFIRDSIIDMNTSDGNSGGIELFGDDLEISNTQITNNTTLSGRIGGLFHSSGTLTISDSTISGNSSPTSESGGLDINGVSYIYNSTIADNEALGGDGGGINNGGTLTIVNTTISGNTSQADGGGIYSGGAVTIINSTISGNMADGNGGGFFGNDDVTIINTTIVNNTADNDSAGGGVGGGIDNAGTTVVENSIVAGNTDDGTAPDIDGTFDSNGFIILGDDTGATLNNTGTGTPIILSDPGSPALNEIIDLMLADNGGPTLTHNLIAGSVAIDAGNNADIPMGTTTDQRGVERILNTTVDIGAVEYAVGLLFVSPANGSSQSGDFQVTVNAQDLNDSNMVNTVENSLTITNGTASNFVDNGDGTTTFTVTPTASGAVTIEGYGDTLTVNVSSTATTSHGATEFTVSPADGTLDESDITVSYTDPVTGDVSMPTGQFTNLVDNGDGSFSFNLAPTQVGQFEVFVDGNPLDTVQFVPLSYGETNDDFVANLYRVLFGRDGSADEINFWTSQMADNGLTIKEVIASFMASDEFTGMFADNAGIVDGIFQAMFGRNADNDFWSNLLDQGSSVYDVALGILNSQEANEVFAQETYNLVFGRVGDQAGAAFWADQLNGGATIEEIQDGMRNAGEGPPARF